MIKKEEVQIDGRPCLKVMPCGMLYSHGREYFLLHPYPLDGDWELFERRFVCVPRQIIEYTEYGYPIYAFARHIVTSSFTIDYCADMPYITIAKLEKDDISDTEWKEIVTYILEIEEDDEPIENFAEVSPVRDVNDVIREYQESNNEEL